MVFWCYSHGTWENQNENGKKNILFFFSRDKQCVLSLDKDAAVILLKYEKVTAKMKKHKNQI